MFRSRFRMHDRRNHYFWKRWHGHSSVKTASTSSLTQLNVCANSEFSTTRTLSKVYSPLCAPDLTWYDPYRYWILQIPVRGRYTFLYSLLIDFWNSSHATEVSKGIQGVVNACSEVDRISSATVRVTTAYSRCLVLWISFAHACAPQFIWVSMRNERSRDFRHATNHDNHVTQECCSRRALWACHFRRANTWGCIAWILLSFLSEWTRR